MFQLLLISIISEFSNATESQGEDDLIITYEKAQHLAQLPLTCYNKHYPFKFNNLWNNGSEVAEHYVYIPIFSGCFDWHSSVHGHWLLASLLNRYPDSELSKDIINVFDWQFTAEKVTKEIQWFKDHPSFERTYGWSWFLYLYHELKKSVISVDHGWSNILEPLKELMVENYLDFLPNLLYPVRNGEHSNTAFGLIFPLSFADTIGNEIKLSELIRHNASHLYSNDSNCPLQWEPSGFDFLSPCLQEAALMGQIFNNSENFKHWLIQFLPSLFDEDFYLQPGEVNDRTDGKLVHLDGLNFSRAWSIYSIVLSLEDYINEQIRFNLMRIGDEHIRKSMDYVIGSDYAGSHWLATFLTHALLLREKIHSIVD